MHVTIKGEDKFYQTLGEIYQDFMRRWDATESTANVSEVVRKSFKHETGEMRLIVIDLIFLSWKCEDDNFILSTSKNDDISPSDRRYIAEAMGILEDVLSIHGQA